MSKAETIRIGKLGKKELRLVRKGARFFGLADGKVCVEGADDVWRQLHDDAGKGDPNILALPARAHDFGTGSRAASSHQTL